MIFFYSEYYFSKFSRHIRRFKNASQVVLELHQNASPGVWGPFWPRPPNSISDLLIGKYHIYPFTVIFDHVREFGKQSWIFFRTHVCIFLFFSTVYSLVFQKRVFSTFSQPCETCNESSYVGRMIKVSFAKSHKLIFLHEQRIHKLSTGHKKSYQLAQREPWDSVSLIRIPYLPKLSIFITFL